MGATRSDLLESSPLHGGNADYVEALYEQYLTDPASVDARWREYFSKLPRGASGAEAFHRSIQSGIAQRAKVARDFGTPVSTGAGDLADEGGKQGAVARLVQIYANRGHLVANLDPLSLTRRERPKVLDLAYFGLSDADLGSVFHTGSRTAGIPKRATLREILQTLNQRQAPGVMVCCGKSQMTTCKHWIDWKVILGTTHAFRLWYILTAGQTLPWFIKWWTNPMNNRPAIITLTQCTKAMSKTMLIHTN